MSVRDDHSPTLSRDAVPGCLEESARLSSRHWRPSLTAGMPAALLLSRQPFRFERNRGRITHKSSRARWPGSGQQAIFTTRGVRIKSAFCARIDVRLLEIPDTMQRAQGITALRVSGLCRYYQITIAMSSLQT